MNPTVAAALAAGKAALIAEVTAPADPFGYGTDLSCTTDITETADEIDPTSVLAIGQALFRRLITPRGTLPDDPDYGTDVRGMLHRGMSQQELLAATGRIKAECEKDDRIESASVAVSPDAIGSDVGVSVWAMPIDDELGAFTLTFAVTDGQAMLEAIKP